MNALFLHYLQEMQNKGRLKFHENHSLSLVSTFGIGGRARVFVIPFDEDSLVKTVRAAYRTVKYKVIGNASNLLFDDNGFSGAIISTVKVRELGFDTSFKRQTWQGVSGYANKPLIKASCGVMLPHLSSFALKNSLCGFEGLCSVPATVGGALCTNAGAYGCEISDNLAAYEIYCPHTDEKRLVIPQKKEFS